MSYYLENKKKIKIFKGNTKAFFPSDNINELYCE